MKIKVCGLRYPENIEALLALPIDFAGFVFYRKSPRYAGNGDLEKWMQTQDDKFAGVGKVGVFVNAEIDDILNKVHDYRLDFVQLHGAEPPEYCRELLLFWKISSLRSARLIKAFSVDDTFDFNQTNPYSGLCRFFLFDTQTSGHGGSGRQFDWALLDRYYGTTPFLLAGGIDLESAASIRQLTHPQLYGVDINSRFEEKPGWKDVERVRRFVEAVKGDG